MSNINETLAAIKEAQLTKSFTQNSDPTKGLQSYDLEAPSKKLYPVPAVLRGIIPRKTGGRSSQANWKSITGINVTNIPGGVAEGARGGRTQHTLVDSFAAFRTLGIENNVTFEAEFAAEGFEDIKALAIREALESLMIIEDKVMLYGNTTTALGTTATPVLTGSTTGGTLAAATYSVIAVALTGQGLESGSVAAGIFPSVTVTKAGGGTQVIDGGAAAQSVAATVVTTGTTSSIGAKTAALRGALGYAWFVGAAGSEKLVAITSINSVVITALNGAGQLASALPAGDKSVNSLTFDGLLTQAMKSGSGAYFKAMPDGVNGVGTGLTSDGQGGIVEIDAALQYAYENFKLAYTHMFVSAQEMKNLKNKVLATTSSAMRFNIETNQGVISGGSAISTYYNPFAAATGIPELKIVVLPFLPAGTILFYSDRLPYAMSNVGNVAEIYCRRDYYQIDWPLVSREHEVGVYTDEVLKHFAPFSMGVITNIANA